MKALEKLIQYVLNNREIGLSYDEIYTNMMANGMNQELSLYAITAAKAQVKNFKTDCRADEQRDI